MEKFSIEIETYYLPDGGQQPNVFNLSGAERRQRILGEACHQWGGGRDSGDLSGHLTPRWVAPDNSQALSGRGFLSSKGCPPDAEAERGGGGGRGWRCSVLLGPPQTP